MSSTRRLSQDHLRTMLAVYRSGSFHAAARHLGVSAPTVANHIHLVEDHFGVRMFERSADGTVPTVAAHEIAAQIATHLDEIDRLIAGDLRRSPTGGLTVSLGGPCEFVTEQLLPALAGDTARLPRIAFEFGDSRRMLAELDAGRLDLAVVSGIRPSGAGVRAWPVARERFWLVAAPGLTDGTEPPAELDAAGLIAYDDHLPLLRRYWNTVFGVDPRFDPTIVLPDLVAMKAAALAGLGVTVLPSYLVHEEVRSGALVRLDRRRDPPSSTVFLAAGEPALAARPPLLRFAELLVDRITGYQENVTQ
ncbi:LysR family transcriptional regulator [Gordonia sihwensis]|uniref:LysR family transcriptional regulator n=1 Tax=Gordonia sihwensis TaxID=173559 RepID=UPI003D98A09E